ncbi:MAG: protein kinase [Steroidobacteraceae bacterium]|nr:protein kinase [Steroidobacteraceae bacterium]MBP7013624.1 protein kinase [Steroidobacteraceae bacterium]
MTNMAALAGGQVVAARYELTRPLAAGHDGGTWLARDTHASRDVVLRFRAADDVAGERIRAGVDHATLLAPLATHDTVDESFDVFEYLPGGEIGRLRGRPWTLIARRLLPVIEALSQLHAAGWVHGDLKSANVVLDGDGRPRLVDLGSARRIGSTQPAGASPYSTSPERLDGAAAAVADDIYALGVLFYELVSGHPPFYPDVTPARVHEEIPPPVAGRPDPPGAFSALVARCLAKRPADRPVSMRIVHEELHLLLETAPAEAVSTVAPGIATWQPRLPADALPVQPQWHRSKGDAPSAKSLRSEGFRRGLLVGAMGLALAAAGFTFFVLPGLVGSQTPAPEVPATPAAAAPAAKPVADFERLAALKRTAEERRGPLPARLQRLEQRDVATWGGSSYAQVRNDLAAGDAAMTGREFETALAHFDAMARGLDQLEQRLPAVIRTRLADAQAAFAAGRGAEAQEKYAAVLKVAPDDAAARSGIARSRVLDEVLRETAVGARAEQAGEVSAAIAAYQRALKLDPATTVARAGIARLGAREADDAYATAMAQAMAALARRDYATAQSAFERAGRIRPGTPEVADGLQQIRRATETKSLTAIVERAAAAERAEQWSQALALYGEALKVEPALRPAQEGVERAEPRAMIDAELQSFIDKPERLYSPSGGDIARNVLERAARVSTQGTRLQAQQARLSEQLRQAETPVKVALASDNATDVQIYRIGKLGLFEHRDLELLPGRYTVVGTRQGYRDVRKELNLLPGAPPSTLVVRCEEPI